MTNNNLRQKPFILITNDDGIEAKGIKTLVEILKGKFRIAIVAPDSARSAQSNAITVTHPIRFKKISEDGDITWYSCTGTPTDCVKLALNEILEKKPDLLLSGINHGSNSAVNVIYSGTMGAVLEGCENQIPSIGLSLCDHSLDADFSHFEPFIPKIIDTTLKNGLPKGVCLNVNAPTEAIKGIKIARQCDGFWTKEFAKRTDPHGRAYFWLTGNFENQEPEAIDTDEWALNHGLISIVPTKIDLTSHETIDALKKWNW